MWVQIAHFELGNAFVKRSASSDGDPVFLLLARGAPRNEDLSCVGVSSQPDDLGVTDWSQNSINFELRFKFKTNNLKLVLEEFINFILADFLKFFEK